MRQARCDSCGAAIIFVPTAAGKLLPLDPEPHRDGNVEIRNGVAAIVSALFRVAMVPRYRPHWATCPHANQHRKQQTTDTQTNGKETTMPNVYDQLKQFDATFDASKPEGAFQRRPGAELLPDGDHDLQIVGARLDTIKGTPVVRFELLTRQGQTIEYVQWMSNQVGANIVGSILVTCAVAADRWKAEGKKFSDELPGGLARIVGLVVRCKKVTETYEGKARAKLYFNEPLGRDFGTAPMPTQTDVWAAPADDEDIPF